MFNFCKIILFVSQILILTANVCSAQTKNQTDTKGLKQGYWEKKDDVSQKIIYKGTFKDDKPQGLFFYYYKNSDSIRTKTEFRQAGKMAYVTMYHLSTGKIQAKGKYLNEEKDSVWNFYDEKGVLISTESYLNGKKNGPSKVFYENGVVSEEKSFKNGLEEGPFKLLYDDKKVKAEGTYLKGQYNGKCSWYFPNGVAAAQGYYVNGIKNAVWVFKTQDGKITDKEVWQNGKQLSPKEAEEFFKKKNISLAEDTKTPPKPQEKVNNNTPKK
jgi:antitoxin component YwqK of YwqJK toxin-antitoxin module